MERHDAPRNDVVGKRSDLYGLLDWTCVAVFNTLWKVVLLVVVALKEVLHIVVRLEFLDLVW